MRGPGLRITWGKILHPKESTAWPLLPTPKQECKAATSCLTDNGQGTLPWAGEMGWETPIQGLPQTAVSGLRRVCLVFPERLLSFVVSFRRRFPGAFLWQCPVDTLAKYPPSCGSFVAATYTL